MDQRISLITLGVRDMDNIAAFYEALGWQRVDTQDGVIAFDLLGQTLGLYPLDKLAEDIGIDVSQLGRGTMTLGYNSRDRDGVDAILARVPEAGGTVLKPPLEVFWGGYHGYFSDPEGHIWEVAHNPFSPLRESDGAFRWAGY
ncbi:VOC family protein [Marivita sp. XM-24bin2]|jgi:catechol 2,3-dioxygenase-like lactoylglutathione lyase family enzyme|uniref:VOC family protein n=1 Tax=unclassified Marivita TaxID=2632480 RepID=UPI000D79E8D6|nr:VOC family protein [Marivita sp. XM-24bin2]MCR9111283.1 VOC family protein [Paracoccaceae bacterium]PWL35161.1 MAG: glyoxalase [Marivita sp. XM-24bin2]